MTSYLARASADLRELQRIAAERPAQPVRPRPVPQYQYPYPPQPTRAPRPAPTAGSARRSRWQASRSPSSAWCCSSSSPRRPASCARSSASPRERCWRPRWSAPDGGSIARPGGRVGAIALAATGIAAAYIDVIAITTIYDWVPAPVGLVIAAVVAGGGLTLARRWDSEQLGLLVLVPLIGLGPVVTDGITLLLVGFMLALSAATLPVQLGKDWTRPARRPRRGGDPAAAHRPASGRSTSGPTSLACLRLRHRRGAGHRGRSGPAVGQSAVRSRPLCWRRRERCRCWPSRRSPVG